MLKNDRVLKKEDLQPGKPYHCWDTVGDYHLCFADNTNFLCSFPWRVRSFDAFRFVYKADFEEPKYPW